jgi:hypothetical protein
MSCPKTDCRHNKKDENNNCTRAPSNSEKCLNDPKTNLFQLKPELMRKAAKKPCRIYNP